MRLFPITKDRYVWGILARTPSGLLSAWSLWQQFTPFSFGRTIADSCVIGNGVPRSGTYLVTNMLQNLDAWTNIGVHVNPRFWDTWQRDGKVSLHPCLARQALNKLRNGQMIGAHLPWSKSLEGVIGQATKGRRIKHVFIRRDPRDVLVSYLGWVTKSANFLTTAGGREFRKFMIEKFDNDDQRLSFIIEQPQHSHTVYSSYEPWLHSPNCIAVKYEDLYSELFELKNGQVGAVFDNLLRYLEIDVTGVDLREFSSQVYGQANTAIGQYQTVFKDQHYAQIDNPNFRSALRAFGYDW